MSIRSTLLSGALLLAIGCNRTDNTPGPEAERLPSSPTSTAQNTALPSSNPSAQGDAVTGPMNPAASNNNTGAANPELLGGNRSGRSGVHQLGHGPLAPGQSF